MKKMILLFVAILALASSLSFAGDPMGLDILQLDNKIVPLYDIQKTYDQQQPQRLISVSASTAAAPKIVINYFHSLLLVKGWKSEGVVSAQGARMFRGDEEIFMVTGTGTGQYHTLFTMRLTTITPESEGARQ